MIPTTSSDSVKTYSANIQLSDAQASYNVLIVIDKMMKAGATAFAADSNPALAQALQFVVELQNVISSQITAQIEAEKETAAELDLAEAAVESVKIEVTEEPVQDSDIVEEFASVEELAAEIKKSK